MLQLKDLPPDIIYEISKHLSLTDICTLKSCCSTLYTVIYNYENSILHNELKKIHNIQKPSSVKRINLEDAFYGFLHYNLVYNFYRYKTSLGFPNGNILREMILHNIGILNDKFVPNIHINKLFETIFNFYICNNYCNIKYYGNKLQLCALYNFLQIEIIQNKYETSYFIDFLNSFNNNKYHDTKIRYYNSIIESYHTNNFFNVTFDNMFTMSSDVISIIIFKKLMGYKVLDLSKTKLNLCCMGCNEEAIFEICNLKRSFHEDDLISHNYNQFKQLLQRENAYYYTFTNNREIFLVNEMIYVKNPITNRRMRVNGNLFKRTISSFLTNQIDKKYCDKILTYVIRRQNYFRNKFFT
jgi:hypothetical protein